MPFPAHMPSFGAFPHNAFYVRTCFPEYFDLIMQFITSSKSACTRVVTVTNSPGVGMTAFLAYCFLRFQAQYPTNPFVFLSFRPNSVAWEALVWENGRVEKHLDVATAPFQELGRMFEDDPNAIFLVDVKLIQSELDRLTNAITSVDLWSSHRPRRSSAWFNRVSRGLFHCYPSSDIFFWDLKTASPYVAKLLSARVSVLPEDCRLDFELAALGCRAAAALRQSIFATRMHKLLENGAEIVANSLAHRSNSPEFDVQISIPRTTSRFSLSNLVRGRCYVLQGNAFERIDAFCLNETDAVSNAGPWEEGKAFMFLTPSKFNYHVPGKQLYSLLRHLKLLLDAPYRVALVHAIPESEADAFETQPIGFSCGLGDAFPVTALDRLSVEMANVLGTAQTRTVGALRRLPVGVSLDDTQRHVS